MKPDKTNYRLAKGDTVITLADYQERYGFLIPAGTLGKVINPRVPRVFAAPKTSLYFALINTHLGLVRLHHNEIRVTRKAAKS